MEPTKAELAWKGKKNTYYACKTCMEKDCKNTVVFNPIVLDEDMEYWSPTKNEIITPHRRERGIFHCDDEGISEGESCEHCGCENPDPAIWDYKRANKT